MYAKHISTLLSSLTIVAAVRAYHVTRDDFRTFTSNLNSGAESWASLILLQNYKLASSGHATLSDHILQQTLEPVDTAYQQSWHTALPRRFLSYRVEFGGGQHRQQL